MKKSIIRLTALICLLALVFSFTACGGEQEEKKNPYEYSEIGLHYTLNENFRRLTVNYAQYCYYDQSGRAYFMFHTYTPTDLEELGYAADISVKNFTLKRLLNDDLPLNVYEYDEATDRSVIRCVDEPTQMADWKLILRGTELLYEVIMSCPVEYRETYEPMFEALCKDIYAE